MNEKLLKDFTEYMINDATQSTIPVIRFYEWSNVDSQPLMFTDIEKFKNFLTYCNITWTPSDEKIWNEGSCHCSCPKSEPRLICKKYIYQVRDEIKGKPSYSPTPYMQSYWDGYDCD